MSGRFRHSRTLSLLAAFGLLQPLCDFRHSAAAAEIDPPKELAPSANGLRPLVAADRSATPLLAPASNEGEARIKQFRHVPGLKIELWAAEPMLANPVAFSVDEQGRVFTTETYRYRSSVLDIRHYMFMLEDDLAARSLEDRLANTRKWFGPAGEKDLSQETEVIRLLEDTDHDGKADKSTVFADGLNSPLDGIASGILARHGEVWLTDIPSLWRFKPSVQFQVSRVQSNPAPAEHLKLNTSSPRVMDGYQAEELLRGWGVRFSFTGHDLHGLKFGPDGRLYFSVGDRGTYVTTREGRVIDLPDEGAVFRCEPDGSNLEVFAHGLRNPQELAFDEYGNLFTGDNDSDQGDRERWEYVVEGGDYGWRVGYQHAPLGNAGPWNMERLWVPHFEGQAAYIIPPIANIGDGPSGLVYDYGTSFPAPLTNRFLLAYFKGTSAKSGVYSLRNRPAGAGFELIAHDEFVWNALVPDVDLGPDGSIWFADWHEGWPKSNKGRLYRAYFPEVIADPVVKETAKLLAEGMTKRTEGQLLGLLAHRDMRVRQEAQFELARRGRTSFDGLKKLALGSKNVVARIHAIWGIEQLLRSSIDADLQRRVLALGELLADDDTEIQAQVVRFWGEIGISNFLREVCRLATSPNLRVAHAALLAYPRMFRRGNYIPSGAEELSLKFQAWQRQLSMDVPKGMHLAITLGNGLATDLVEAGLTNGNFGDPILRQARVGVLTEIGGFGFKQFLALADTNRESQVRVLGLLARRNLRDDSIAAFLSDPDPLLVLEAARAINDVPITNALPALAALAEPAKLDPLLLRQTFATADGAGRLPARAIRDVRADQPLPWGDAPIDQLTPLLLRVVNANFRLGASESAGRLAALAVRTDLSDLVRSEALHALAIWAKPPARDRIVGTYRPLPERDASPAREALRPQLAELLAKSPEAIRVAAAEAAAQLQLADAVKPLFALVTDTAAPALARAAAMRALNAVAKDRPAIIARDEALTFAAADSAEPLRLEASKLNAELNPNDAAGQLAAKLTTGSLAEQQAAFASLGSLKSDAADAILADWLDKLMKREVANEVMLDLVEAAGKRNAAAVKTRLTAYEDWKLPKDHLSPYREALLGGDAARGKKTFYENAAVACTRCHQIGSDGGGNAGPKLDGVASRQTREYLLESVVFSNQQIVPGFETAIVTLKNGQSYAGVVKGENDTDLVILSPEEGDVTLQKAEVQSREKGLSGMPEGLGQLLSRSELRDVIEFLGTLK